MAEWHMEHRTRDYSLISRHTCAGDIDINRNRNSPSSINYMLARSDPALKRDSVVPYETFFHLFRDSVRIMSGPVTEVGWDDSNEGVISIAGQTWLHMLERRVAPYNGPARATWIPFKNKNITQIIDEVIGLINNPNQPPVNWNPPGDVGLQWIVDYVENGTTSPIRTPASEQLAALDGQSIFDFIQRMSEKDGDYGGYDFEGFYYSPGVARLVIYSPDRRSSFSRTPVRMEYNDFVSFKWANKGIKGNNIFYIGTTLGTTVGVDVQANKDVVQKTDTSSMNRYGLHEAQEDLDTYQDEDHVDKAATSQFKIDRHQLHEISCSFDTQAIFNKGRNFWTQLDPGDDFNIDVDFGFHRVNARYVMNSYQATISDNGDELIVPDFERVWE